LPPAFSVATSLQEPVTGAGALQPLRHPRPCLAWGASSGSAGPWSSPSSYNTAGEHDIRRGSGGYCAQCLSWCNLHLWSAYLL